MPNWGEGARGGGRNGMSDKAKSSHKMCTHTTQNWHIIHYVHKFIKLSTIRGKKGWHTVGCSRSNVPPGPSNQCWSAWCLQPPSLWIQHWMAGNGEGIDEGVISAVIWKWNFDFQVYSCWHTMSNDISILEWRHFVIIIKMAILLVWICVISSADKVAPDAHITKWTLN